MGCFFSPRQEVSPRLIIFAELITQDRVQRGMHLNNNTLATKRAFIMNYYRRPPGKKISGIYYYFLEENCESARR